MAKRRSCRRTKDEEKIHEKAVKMRKLTDEQLVHYVEDRVEKARREGINSEKKKEQEERMTSKTVPQFIEDLSNSAVPGIGKITLLKMQKFAVENGYGRKMETPTQKRQGAV